MKRTTKGHCEPKPLEEQVENILQIMQLENRYVLECDEIKDIQQKLGGIEIAELLQLLLPIIKKRAIVPISNFYIGVATLAKSGRVYLGHNVEFSGVPLSQTIHAEGFAICKLFISGEEGIELLVVNAPPCGFCRQHLAELQVSSLDIQIYITKPKLHATLKTLLPHSFGPIDLGNTTCLLNRKGIDHKTILEVTTSDIIINSALEAANFSYCPYTKCPSGISIQTKTKKVYQGSTLENAAYNPSYLPFQVAIICLLSGNDHFEDIERVVLVQLKNGTANVESNTRETLAHVVPTIPLEVYYCVNTI